MVSKWQITPVYHSMVWVTDGWGWRRDRISLSISFNTHTHTHTHTHTEKHIHTLILQPQVSSTHLLQQPAILYLSTSPVCNNTLCLALRNSIMISLGTVTHSLTPSFTQTQTIMWYYRLHFSLCLPDTVSLCELGTPGPVLIWTHPTSSESSASKRLFNFGHRFH